MAANLPFPFKACKAARSQREKCKNIGTDGLRLKDVKVTEKTLCKEIIYVLALLGSGQLTATDFENYALFWSCMCWEEIYLYSILSLVMFRAEQGIGQSKIKRIADSTYDFVIATHFYF